MFLLLMRTIGLVEIVSIICSVLCMYELARSRLGASARISVVMVVTTAFKFCVHLHLVRGVVVLSSKFGVRQRNL